jgi:S-(hydroxymethyl)glutathione dehydrogenase/alcohol dehydrogenase
VGAISQATWALGMGGKWIQVGIHPAHESANLVLTFFPTHCKSCTGTLYGNIRTHEDIPKFAEMIVRGEYRVDNLFTKTFKLEEINQVADAMKERQIMGRWVCKFD